jgi:hypothetical protein
MIINYTVICRWKWNQETVWTLEHRPGACVKTRSVVTPCVSRRRVTNFGVFCNSVYRSMGCGSIVFVCKSLSDLWLLIRGFLRVNHPVIPRLRKRGAMSPFVFMTQCSIKAQGLNFDLWLYWDERNKLSFCCRLFYCWRTRSAIT